MSKPDPLQAALAAAVHQLHAADEVWKLALEASGDGVWDWYIQAGVELYSAGFLQIYGYSPDDLEANPAIIDSLTHPDDREQMSRDRQAHFDGLTPVYSNEHRVRCKDGSWKWVQTRGMVIARDEQGRPLRMVGTHTDITERKRVEALTWRQANYDALTDLPNRRLLAERLGNEMKKVRREGRHLALLALDLDRFKEVNDRLGHDAGDELLRQAARRIANCIREVDMVARLGGDEFIVLLADLQGEPSSVERVANALVNSLAQPFALADSQQTVSVSVGIALFPADADDAQHLFKRADQALYAAKHAGRNGYRFAGRAVHEAAQARSRLGAELRLALERQEFCLHFQPVLPADGGACTQAEVLLRWRHPVLGLLGPGSFLALAESSGLICEIGAWVLQDAAAQLKAWRRELQPELSLAVNLSGTQLREWGCSVTDWAARLLRLGVPGSGLVLDLREAQLRDPQIRGLMQLPALRAAGIGLALDDFGAGDSMLHSLRHPGLSQLKFSRELLADLRPGSREADWLAALVQLAGTCGLNTVAKGVETAVQARMLISLGVGALQGHHLAPAIPASEFRAWLDRHKNQLPPGAAPG
ncbi:putative bifunctional diguanylate cyclase/phosphodiesterase [Inhella proteolytica]|uniref:EAL domain-containing protein n=1 Tax=Inhella proteolytica TaxID=2795029 RepID=A0A931NJY4_9BURK|nr:EAL domain-containing protein [Inhella proteolytica]MBH9579454.1 EAL domain-containing protein [Inhella proteolytica]